ncbi:MAG TPA: ATP-binding cassette domain-containing protein [Elainellaceae cyanobacterium]
MDVKLSSTELKHQPTQTEPSPHSPIPPSPQTPLGMRREHSITPPRSSSPTIHVQGLRQHYGAHAAVGGIDFTVHPGEIFGLIGTNGAGKTTTLEVLAGVRRATAGRVQVLGQPPHAVRHAIGYLTQQFSLYPDLSVNENLRYSAKVRRVPEDVFQTRREKYLQWVGLAPVADRLAGQLSGGMKQKLAICCALIFQPQVLLLDELSTGIDIVPRREIWDLLPAIARRGVTIIVATHYLDEAERCHRVALLHQGTIQQIGTPAELRHQSGLRTLDVVPDDRAHAAGDTFRAIESVLRTAQSHPSMAIADVQPFGDRLAVLINHSQATEPHAETEIRHLLHQHQLAYLRIQPAPLTLENVMAAHLRSQQSEFPRMAFPFVRSECLTSKTVAPSLVLRADSLQKVYRDVQPVKRVSLEIRQGEICGLLGANGAGKTTLIKLLCGLLKPSQGRVGLVDRHGLLQPPQRMKQQIGYMSQTFTLYPDLTVRENLEFFSRVYRIPRRHRSLKMDWGLTTMGLTQYANQPVEQLSGGNRQRVAFGAAVMHEPQILFLDEPTSGMDILSRRQFWQLLQDLARQGTAVMVTTHSLEEAEYCTRLVLMRSGELIAQGSPSQLKANQSGQLVELQTNDLPAILPLLQAELPPWRISFFGDRLHLILDQPDQQIPALQSTLAAIDQEATLQSIPFTLEAAFINLIQSMTDGSTGSPHVQRPNTRA